jgi:hypothetical protein
VQSLKKKLRQPRAKRTISVDEEATEGESGKPKKRVRQPRGKTSADEAPVKRAREKKLKKKMDTVTYTLDSVMVEFDADSEFGKALRAMTDSDRIVAVAKLNKGATDGIKGAVKAKVMSSKYSTICMDKLKEHLCTMRVAEQDMFRKAAPVSSGRTIGCVGGIPRR